MWLLASWLFSWKHAVEVVLFYPHQKSICTILRKKRYFEHLLQSRFSLAESFDPRRSCESGLLTAFLQLETVKRVKSASLLLAAAAYPLLVV